MPSAWVAFGSPSSHFQDSVVGLDVQSQPTVPEASSDRHNVAVALSSSLAVAMTPCYCGALGGLSVLVGSLTSLSPRRKLGPSCHGLLTCRVTRLT